ncbi:MAG TPA: alpha-L-fucosidase [Terriglobia bacterium]|jgi:alpha-L-fucosidase|nr:alpha-L-fucosidase [Terriglobia bacterium]
MRGKFSRRRFLESIPLTFAAGRALTIPWTSLAATPFPGQFQPNYDSLSAYQIPEWFKEAKLGIFLHWGIYSVPAYSSEWYPRLMYLRKSPVFDWHRKHWGPQSMFGYKDFIPMFHAERWKPEEWVDLFKRAGARYIVPVGEHCDGFPMYDCTFTRWCASKMGPQRDIVRDLSREVRNQGLKLGVSIHRNWHYSWYTYESDFDTNNPLYSGLYGRPHVPGPLINEFSNDVLQVAPQWFLQDWLSRTTEIIDKYHPDLIWLEWGVQAEEFRPYRTELAAYYYNLAGQRGQEVVLTYKGDAFPEHAAVQDIERGTEAEIRALPWQAETSISRKSWGYVEDDEYRTPGEIIHEFVDIVSKNGNMLLNFGPKPDGTFSEEALNIAHSLAQWTGVNGEAIFGSSPWKIYGEGPTNYKSGTFGESKTSVSAFTSQDIRFTTKTGAIFAIFLAWPERQAVIKALGSNSPYAPPKISEVKLLGEDAKLRWHRTGEALVIDTPPRKPCDHAYVFSIR